jgi:hypothetical protein
MFAVLVAANAATAKAQFHQMLLQMQAHGSQEKRFATLHQPVFVTPPQSEGAFLGIHDFEAEVKALSFSKSFLRPRLI